MRQQQQQFELVELVVRGDELGSASSGSSGGAAGGTITIASGTPPLSADQGLDFTTQGNELYSVIDTPLLTFVRGVAGHRRQQDHPGAGQEPAEGVQRRQDLHLPAPSRACTTPTGRPIKASDVTYALERDIKIPWQAASFISAYVKGGDAYAKGKAKTISGVTTDDATGKIVVNRGRAVRADRRHLRAPRHGAGAAKSTPMKNLASTGTIGDGPYMWGPISPGHTYTVVKNPKFDVPGLPKGHADKIVYNVNSNVLANAEAVLNNQADVFDPGDTLPASILQQVKIERRRSVQAGPAELELVLLVRGHAEAVQQPLRAPGGAGGDGRPGLLTAGQRLPGAGLPPDPVRDHRPLQPLELSRSTTRLGPPNMTLAKQLMRSRA